MASSLGKAWVVFSENATTGERKLISLLSPRRSRNFVCQFVEQIYVDQFASIEEKISYKKDASSWPYPAKAEHPSGIIHCGHNPFFCAILCHSINISGTDLQAEFSSVKNYDQSLHPTEFHRGQLTVAT